jgi:hypothetical protein
MNTNHLITPALASLNLTAALCTAALCLQAGCGDDGGASDETSQTGDGDGDPGDGDGDPGDGDGDPGDGDGDPGDGDGDPGDGDGDPAGVTDEEVLALIADYSSTFVQINDAPVVSGAHMGGGIMVNVWVDPAHADVYKALDPANPVDTEFPEGMIVIKEHLDDMMAVAGGTIMFKGPAGYDSDNGDWWYGMGDLEGTLVASGPGLADCLACHVALASTDYLHGIDPANQAP